MDKYEYIINNSRDFITLINRDYVYEIVNDTYCNVIEKPKAQVLGSSVAEVWGKDVFYNTIKGYLDRCFAGEYVHYIEQFKFGSFSKYMHVSYYPYYENGDITHVIVFSHDITHIGELESRLNHYEYRDPVTGLFNRRSLNVILDRELERARRSNEEKLKVLLFVDVMMIEKVVQFHGQEIGDLLLENTGLRIKAQLRSSDYVFRFDGNRFAVLLPRVSNKLDAGTVAAKIHQNITIPYDFKGNDIKISCSIGAAVYPHDGEQREELINNAISAMLEAGQGERDFLLFDEEMHQQAVRRIYLESAAQRALEERQFAVYYQPIVDMNGRILGAEALLRWQHPEMGAISPGDFIPIAEQSGLIQSIGKWVLFRVCQTIAEWGEKYGIFISLNMSAREFASPDLRDTVSNALTRGGVSRPEYLKIEITETSCVRNIEQALSHMQILDDLGVHIYIDDFGTGQASLQYLKRIPARVLKIDREFITGIEADEEQYEFLTSIIQMVKSRGKTVVAEGVSTAEQARLLGQTECDRMQGYYFARPLSMEAFTDLLERAAILPASGADPAG
jgi:diguanylate cyclase (GGDEF)-like protein/PAS domain S-box-containing protein